MARASHRGPHPSKEIMKANLNRQLPQEGSGCSAPGQSLTDASASVFPSYSGGGKDRHSNESEQSDSSMITAESRESPPPLSCTKKRPCLKERSRSGSDESSSGEEMSTVKKLVTSKRGRGRPPTTGQYVGLKKAKESYLRLQRKEMELEAERDLQEQMRARQQFRSARGPSPTPQNGSVVDLHRQVEENLNIVSNVATKSKNLKGTFQRALKDAASSIRFCVENLVERNITEETRQLQEANTRLQSELTELRKEVAQLRIISEQTSKSRAEETGTLAQRPDIDIQQLSQSIIAEVGCIMNAKFKALEEKLLPEKSHSLSTIAIANDTFMESSVRRPRTTLAPEQQQVPEVLESSEVREDKEAKSKRKREKNKNCNSAGGRPTKALSNPHPLPTVPVSTDDGWVKVVKRRSNRKKKSGAPQIQKKKVSMKSMKPSTLRSPRSAAIVLTLKPGAEERGVTYASVLREAKATDLSGMGLTSIRVRKTATGARILEIPGASSGEKADEMAKRLGTTLNNSDVRVSRVTKCVEMRISELDDSITKEEVAAAVSHISGCPVSQIKTGDLREDNSGMFTIWVRCPVAAAKVFVDSGRILVGWVSARVKMLAPKTRHCWRCLEMGHVREGCLSEIDRSNLCFRCGKPGHKANVCSAAPHCALCADANSPASHTFGSKLCSTYFRKKPQRAQKAIYLKSQRRQIRPPASNASLGEEVQRDPD